MFEDQPEAVVAGKVGELEADHRPAVGEPVGVEAVARVPEDATAYAHRDAVHNININGVWLPGEPVGDRETAWARDLFAALEPYQHGVYVNFLGDEGLDRVRAAYGDALYARLASVKAAYDPANLFRLNQNIEPAIR